jgi:hypothetical protein
MFEMFIAFSSVEAKPARWHCLQRRHQQHQAPSARAAIPSLSLWIHTVAFTAVLPPEVMAAFTSLLMAVWRHKST